MQVDVEIEEDIEKQSENKSMIKLGLLGGIAILAIGLVILNKK